MIRVYSLSLEKVSPAGVSDVEGREGGDEEGRGVEDEGGEAVDVMMERREAVDEGTTGEGLAWAFALLWGKIIDMNTWDHTF